MQKGGLREMVHMKAALRALVSVFLSTVLFFPAGASAQQPAADTFHVDEVRLEGNRRIDTNAIRLQLKKTSGLLGSEDISDEVKILYRTGFFDQVQAGVLPVPGSPGHYVLKYTLIEKPVVRKVFIKGNENVEDDDLLNIFKFGSSRFLDKTKIDSLIRSASQYYQSRGYYDASFEYSAVPAGENQVDITFIVTEGKRYKIAEVEFRGLKELDESDVMDAIQTKRYKWWSSWLLGTGRLNPEMLQNDKGLIRQYMFDQGLVDGSVGDPVVEKKDDGSITITFDINEGRVYSVGKVAASGDLLDGSVEKTLGDIDLTTGKTFSATKLRDDSFKINEQFQDLGYAYSNTVPDTNINKEDATVDINYVVQKGEPVHINRINIRGNTKTYDNVIRRELKVDEQELYSGSKVKRSQALLQRLGYFEEVNIATEPAETKDKINLLVNVREASTGQFSIGAGYSTSDGPLFNARLSENNLLGTGKRVSLDADIGTRRNNASLSYYDRRFLDTYLATGAEVFRSEREYSDFDRLAVGGAATLGYPLEEVFGKTFEDIGSALRYELMTVDIRDVDPNEAAELVIQSQGETTSSAIRPSLTRNTINNPLNPSRGSEQVLAAEYAGLGGDAEYMLYEAKNAWYYPVLETSFGNFVLSFRTRFGYGDSLNDQKFPLFRRYFPGGINSVRGYKDRTLGPKDSRGHEYGGSKQFVHNNELIFPIAESAGIKGVVFYDLGQAYDDDDSVDFGELRKGYGAGIRWISPIGPLRIEFGFPVGREPGESRMVTMFTFGAPY